MKKGLAMTCQKGSCADQRLWLSLNHKGQVKQIASCGLIPPVVQLFCNDFPGCFYFDRSAQKMPFLVRMGRQIGRCHKVDFTFISQ